DLRQHRSPTQRPYRDLHREFLGASFVCYQMEREMVTTLLCILIPMWTVSVSGRTGETWSWPRALSIGASLILSLKWQQLPEKQCCCGSAPEEEISPWAAIARLG